MGLPKAARPMDPLPQSQLSTKHPGLSFFFQAPCNQKDYRALSAVFSQPLSREAHIHPKDFDLLGNFPNISPLLENSKKLSTEWGHIKSLLSEARYRLKANWVIF